MVFVARKYNNRKELYILIQRGAEEAQLDVAARGRQSRQVLGTLQEFEEVRQTTLRPAADQPVPYIPAKCGGGDLAHPQNRAMKKCATTPRDACFRTG